MRIKGRVHKFKDNVNTDEIIPASYLNTQDPAELGRHCMQGIDKDFVKRIKTNDIIVAGKNFGCGSSREHAPLSLKGAGISCIIGISFARIFYRNCINIGLPIMESKEAAKVIKAGDILNIDTETGRIEDVTQKREFRSQRFPQFMQEIIKRGGLMQYIRKRREG
ncbi:MAG: 3-isopropylmalate dehydratase small subunit [Candidatus Omnitrophica bacterium]|nr:3-isopropylmalate dehydratase small subunit [Candidatus Omnitrophota bacterium]